MFPRRLAVLLCALVTLVLYASRAQTPSENSSVVGSLGRGPAIVLVHGLGSRATHWLPVARDLARDHRVVLVDLPGHGEAAMPGSLTLDGAADVLDRGIAAESAGEEPVVLVGHSVGGLVAAVEALRHPQRIRGLVLIETALRPQLSPQDQASLLGAFEQDYHATLRAAYADFGRDSLQGLQLYGAAAQLDSAAFLAWVRLAISSDLSARIADLKIPMLVVLAPRSWGETESWPAVAESLGYAQARDVTPLRFEGCGHFVMLDRPQMLANAIRRFARGAAPQVLALR